MYRAATLSVVLLTTLGCAGPTKIAKLDQPPPRGQSLAHWIDRTTSLQSASKLPKAGEDFAMIYDPLRHRIVMFGGKGDDDKNTNDVWTFELARNRWQQVEIASEQPPASEDHTLIYDPIGYRMILYGGEDGPTWNNTYSFDLKTYQWIDLTDSTAPIREDHTAIYDSKGKR
ncbi:hypothetical protein GWO43_10975, partial [candidate division KSB1 bacterium]|nr:hypothetical protein [candidate division KSB1 bacterium]NIR70295.1 hypothetical protein [candidate division KSB1 bacterium]NIS24456.1 hypothetical protein [candidate division KSB1 bacterium]NIT71391.1 hypothetical protein [candidate division KSB1 bacterium]NIU25076.1 hypothetical protein [candidate division KSB1 bacterium]